MQPLLSPTSSRYNTIINIWLPSRFQSAAVPSTTSTTITSDNPAPCLMPLLSIMALVRSKVRNLYMRMATNDQHLQHLHRSPSSNLFRLLTILQTSCACYPRVRIRIYLNTSRVCRGGRAHIGLSFHRWASPRCECGIFMGP